MTPTRPVVLVLALSSLVFASLMPPEAYPVGKMGVILCSTFSFLIALSERRIPAAYLLGGITVFLLLFGHSLFISVDAHRSLEFVTILWAYYCLIGFFMYSGSDSATYFAGITVMLAAVVSAYGIYQYFWGFAEMQSYVVYSVSGRAEKSSALGIIGTGRVFSTLALPGTLWGFLLTALPLHALLWNQHHFVDGLLVAGAALLLAAGLLTQSFGFVLGLLILGAAYLIQRRILRLKAVVLFLSLAATAGTFYVARRGAIQEANPMVLRAKSWVSAWNIFALNPMGTGLNTFGVMYPQYMQPKANETQFAHNTPLQLMSELGYPAVLAAMAFIVFLMKTNRVSLRDRQSFYLLLALLVWAVHNIIDINVYFPSVGVPGAIVIGILLSRRQTQLQTSSKLLIGAAGVITSSVLVFSGLNLVSSELEHRAQIEYETGQSRDALETLDSAKRFSPLNSTIFEDSGEILLDLHHKEKDPQDLARATASFQRAIELSPLKADPHVWFALSLSSAGRVDTALEEIYLARSLFPSSDRIPAIIRLMEKNREE